MSKTTKKIGLLKLPSLKGKNHYIINTTIRNELHLIITYLYGPFKINTNGK